MLHSLQDADSVPESGSNGKNPEGSEASSAVFPRMIRTAAGDEANCQALTTAVGSPPQILS